MNFNHVHSYEDISEESGPAAEPVTLQEVKNYLRMEGFGGQSTGLAMQTPLTLTLVSGFSVQSSFLVGDNVVMTNVQREGLGYTVVGADETPVGRQCSFDNDTGIITFPDEGANVTIDVQYGFSDEDTDAEVFEFDDDLIEELIVAGRTWCETKTGCSLVTKTIRAYVTNLLGRQLLPGGPITGTVTGVNDQGDAVTIEIFGSAFPELKSPKYADLTLTYAAGYTPQTIPKGLKQAILAYCAATYENRGDEEGSDLSLAAKLCKPYVKASAWA